MRRWTTAATALTGYNTKITASAASRTLVTGQLANRSLACRSKRQVRVIRLGSTSTYKPSSRTNSKGRFAITAATSPYDKFYVDAPAKKVRVNGKTILCRYGHSPLFSPN